MKDSVIPVAVKSNQSSEVGLEAQSYTPNQIDEKLREIKELKDNIPPEKPKDNSLKPDDSKQAIMMLALCALCIIGAIATGGVLAQVIGVAAAATGLFGLKKAKDAIFPPGAPIEKKVKSAHEKAIDAKLKELQNIVEFQKGFERAQQGGAEDPDLVEREARKGNYFKTAIPKLSTQEIAGFRQGMLDRQQREQQSNSGRVSPDSLHQDLNEIIRSEVKEALRDVVADISHGRDVRGDGRGEERGEGRGRGEERGAEDRSSNSESYQRGGQVVKRALRPLDPVIAAPVPVGRQVNRFVSQQPGPRRQPGGPGL